MMVRMPDAAANDALALAEADDALALSEDAKLEEAALLALAATEALDDPPEQPFSRKSAKVPLPTADSLRKLRLDRYRPSCASSKLPCISSPFPN